MRLVSHYEATLVAETLTLAQTSYKPRPGGVASGGGRAAAPGNTMAGSCDKVPFFYCGQLFVSPYSKRLSPSNRARERNCGLLTGGANWSRRGTRFADHVRHVQMRPACDNRRQASAVSAGNDQDDGVR